MARIKQVFSGKDQIAHLWAHQLQKHARNSLNNFYFYSESIYSYGSHFEIARIVTPKEHKNKNYGTLVLWYDHSYSHTTSKQQNAVRYAIPNHYTRINVDKMPCKYGTDLDIDYSKDKKTLVHNVREHIRSVKLLAEKQLRARKYDYTREINSHIKHAVNLTNIFKLKSKLKKSEKELIYSDNPLEILLSEDAIKKIKENKRKAIEAEKRKKAKELAEAKKGIKKWRNYETNHCPYAAGYLLRIKDKETIETSRNAQVPINKAEKLWKLVQHVVQTGQQWKRNGKTFEIGVYSVDLIHSSGNMVVGCHKIEYKEMLNLATKLGWA